MLQIKAKLLNNTLGRVFSAFSIKIFGTFFSFLTSIIISRSFSSAGVGIYSLSNSILSICMIIARFGFDLAIIKYVSIDYNKGNHGDLRRSIQYVLKISTLIATLLAVVIFTGSDILAIVFSKPNLSDLLRITIWVIIPSTIIQILAAAYKAIKHVQLGLFYESVTINGMFSFALILTIFVLKNKSLQGLGWAYLIATIIICVSAIIIWKRFSKDFNNNASEKYSFKPVIRTAFPLLLVNSTNYILGSTDILMLGLWLSASDVGLYNIATKITLLSSMLLSAINALVGPRFAVMFEEGKVSELSRLVKKTSRLMVAAAVLICCSLGIFAKLILSIWGSEFVAGASVLYISLIGQFVVLATGPLATLLMMCGLEKVHRNNTVFCAVLNIILNYILIQKVGVEGAALATAISLIVKNVYCVFAVKKRLGFWCY